MHQIVPFVHEGLGNSSYLVGLGDGACLVVDPDRSVDRYLAAARGRDWQITAILETHVHADFVSGALEIRNATGADVFLPAGGQVRFPHRAVTPSASLNLQGVSLTAVASPGHTPEHLSYALNREGLPPALFSGGSLLVGGAARTDLISPEQTDALTRAQFQTITRAFNDLPDETLLLPTHGGGSFCSSGSGAERVSTLGVERRQNPLLAQQDEDAFATWFPTTFPAVPDYFLRMRRVNQRGPRLRCEIPAPPVLEPIAFQRSGEHALVVDVRPQAEFIAGHIPGALSNAFRDSFSTWLGWLVPENQPLLFVVGDADLALVMDECLLVGYEHFAGVLAGGMEAWEAAGLPIECAGLATAASARSLLTAGAAALDVREPNEFAAGHIPGALNVPLGQLKARMNEVPVDRPLVTYCGHGERSATALSLLQAHGYGPVVNLDGGIGAWVHEGMPIEH